MNSERMYKVLVAPHVSEKSALIGELANQYTFKVAKDATKSEIKNAVEQLFNVSVVELQVLNVKGKALSNNNGGIKKCTTTFLWVLNLGQFGELPQ